MLCIGETLPGQEGTWGQQLCPSQGPCPLASCPGPWVPAVRAELKEKRDGLELVPVAAHPLSPSPASPPAAPRAVLLQRWLHHGAVFAETVGDGVCVKLALLC